MDVGIGYSAFGHRAHGAARPRLFAEILWSPVLDHARAPPSAPSAAAATGSPPSNPSSPSPSSPSASPTRYGTPPSPSPSRWPSPFSRPARTSSSMPIASRCWRNANRAMASPAISGAFVARCSPPAPARWPWPSSALRFAFAGCAAMIGIGFAAALAAPEPGRGPAEAGAGWRRRSERPVVVSPHRLLRRRHWFAILAFVALFQAGRGRCRIMTAPFYGNSASRASRSPRSPPSSACSPRCSARLRAAGWSRASAPAAPSSSPASPRCCPTDVCGARLRRPRHPHVVRPGRRRELHRRPRRRRPSLPISAR